MTLHPRVVPVVVVFLLSALVANEGYRIWDRFINVPYIYSGGWADPEVIPVGGELRTHYRFERHRICQTDLNRFIARLPGNEIVWRDRVPGGATGLGKHQVVNVIGLPEGMQAGDYVLRIVNYSTCGETSYSAIAPDVSFRIVNLSPAAPP